MTDEPILLDWTTHWCARHLEPFRAKWPHGALIAMVLMFDAAAQDVRIQEAADCDANRLDAVLLEFSPLCCLVGDEITQEIVEQALAGRGPRIDAIKERKNDPARGA